VSASAPAGPGVTSTDDLSALGELDRVGDQVHQHLPEPGRVADQRARHLGRKREQHFELLLPRALAHDVGDVGEHVVEPELDVLERELAGFDAG
jgi:hypothetical protein